MKTKELPPVELLKELFDYDPLTGLLRWKKRTAQRIEVGDVAGTRTPNNYIMVKFKGQAYPAHRLCWAIYYNEQLSPSVGIDHKYGIRDDNRISELRKATDSEQNYNRETQSNNTSGHRGVSFAQRDKVWRAKLGTTDIGRFKTKEEAIDARLKAEKDLNIFVGERTEVR